jgi:hypothetical protein
MGTSTPDELGERWSSSDLPLSNDWDEVHFTSNGEIVRRGSKLRAVRVVTELVVA